MRSTTDITYGVTGQTLAYRVPQGRPTSATFAVFRDTAGDDDVSEFTGTATVDTVSTTVSIASGASSADPQRIDLTSSTGLANGTKYLLAEVGKQEWVEPVEVGTAYVRVRHPLKNDYTASATVKSTTITAAVDATWVATLAKLSDHKDPAPSYRARWAIVVGGVTVIAYSYFDLVRAPTSYLVDLDELNSRAPGLVDSMPTEYRVENGRPMIDAAWRAVRAHLASMGLDTDAIRDDEALDELVTLRSLRSLAEAGWRPPGFELTTYLELTRANYDAFFTQNVLTMTKLATDSGGGVERIPVRTMWSK